MRLTEEGRFDFLSHYYREGYNYLFRVGSAGICFSDNRPYLGDYDECLRSCNHYTFLQFYNKKLADEILGDRQIIDLRDEYDLMDWTKAEVDMPVIVRDRQGQEWVRRYFAKYEDGKVWTFYQGTTSWSAGDKDHLTPWNFAKVADVEDDYE